MNSNIRKAAIYCKGNDLAYQAGIAATFIIDRGLSFSGLYLENDSLNILAQACARGYVDAIIVKNINVLTDDIEALTVFEEQLPVPIICVEDLYCTKENLDFETLEYKEPVKHKTAQHKESLSKSLSDILREKKENGDILGVVPFGYLKENEKLIPDPKTASCVRKIFTKAKDGEKITAIARWLEQEGILTLKRFVTMER